MFFFPENICRQFLDCIVKENSCNTVKSAQYQECIDCFKGGDAQECRSKYSTNQAEVKQVGNKLEVKLNGYFRVCDDKPKLFLDKYGNWVETTIEPPWDSAAIVDGSYDFYMCDVVACQNIKNDPLEIKLKKYDSLGEKNYNGQKVPAYTKSPVLGNIKIEVDYYQTEQDCQNRNNKKMFSKNLVAAS